MTGLEKLLKQKLPADVFKAVVEALDEKDLDYVPRYRLTEVIEERDDARKEAEGLRKTAGKDNSAEIQKKLDDLQAKYDTDIAQKDAEFAGYRRESQITEGINGKHAKNTKAVRALLDGEALKEDLSGLETELARIMASDPYLFGDAPNVPSGTGTGVGGTNEEKNSGGLDSEAMYSAIFGGVY